MEKIIIYNLSSIADYSAIEKVANFMVGAGSIHYDEVCEISVKINKQGNNYVVSDYEETD